jgi:1-deoxy-D-xylulose-5-phosphate synthase
MCELMAKDEKIIALTAAMPDGTGVDKVLEKFPERAFDVGIAEQHAITFCAGMACEGLKPVAAIYSTFLQRAFDQVIHDVCLQDLNVTFAMDRAGIVGADGPTHHGLLDISYLRGYPNIVLMAPKDEAEMRDMMLTAIDHPGPAAIRYPRGNGFGADISAEPKHIEIGKAEVLREGNSGIVILAYGSMVYPSVEAAAILANEGIDATVVNARFVKPLDEETILALAADNQAIVTVEEAYLAGGFGSAVMELLEQHNMLEDLSVHRMGVSDEIVTHGDPKILLARYGLDADGIAKRVREVVGGIKKQSNRSTLLKAVK